MISCSTGQIGGIYNIGEEKLIFWDRNTTSTSVLVAPSLVVEDIPQTQLWKIGLALYGVNVSVNLFNPLHRDLSLGQWLEVFQNKNSTCHRNYGENSTLCYEFKGQVLMLDDAAFMLCRHPSITQVEGGYVIQCNNPLITNRLNENYIGYAVFLLRVPPYTIHPVQVDDFATSISDELIGRLSRQKREGELAAALSVVNLALNVIEEIQIHDIQNQLSFVATSLQQFMVENGQAWRHQEQIDSALLARIAQTTEVLQVVVHQQALMLHYMRMQCHYKYYPVCVTPVPFNSTLYQYLEDVLRNATYVTNVTSDLTALDLIISAMQNASTVFVKEWNEEISKGFTSWFKGVNLTDLVHWITIGFIGIGLLMLTFCLLPCILSILLKTIRAALEALKADILYPFKNKKGEL
ncbi:uncharacterized protein LOC127559373 [Antechinus flavipes]|uniref:uncharacterized protein LOC127559373 n=1 Tax=Antechinus flavipes TaxID=38775 RepID=UPI002235C758|nr:uncharacterized protein LOC127559373 [Antechinus flavipes]